MEQFKYSEKDGMVSLSKEDFERLVYQLEHLFKHVPEEYSYAARDLLRDLGKKV